jgi:hypothetical protein
MIKYLIFRSFLNSPFIMKTINNFFVSLDFYVLKADCLQVTGAASNLTFSDVIYMFDIVSNFLLLFTFKNRTKLTLNAQIRNCRKKYIHAVADHLILVTELPKMI